MDRYIAMIMLKRVPIALLFAFVFFALVNWGFAIHWVFGAIAGILVFGITILSGPRAWEHQHDSSLGQFSSSSSSSSFSDSSDSSD